MFSLLSSDVGQVESLVLDNWTFAGTIVSIILAVIAILYTFDQSSTTVTSTKKLEESASRVETATKELENNNVKIVVSELEERLHRIIQEMQHGIQNDININIGKPLENLLNLNNNKTPFNKNAQILNEDEWGKYVVENTKTDTNKELNVEGLTLFYIYFLYVNEKQYSLNATKKWLRKMDYEESEVILGSGVIHGEIRLLQAFNVLEVIYLEEESEVSKIISINEILKKHIEEIIEKPEEEIEYLLKNFVDIFNVKQYKMR